MKKLGQLLLEKSFVSAEQLQRALQNQRVVGGRLGTCLLESDAVTEELLLRTLSEQLGVPAASADDLRGIPDEVFRLLPAKVAIRCRAVPFRALGTTVDVALLDVRNLAIQDELGFVVGRRIKIHVATELRIREALEKYYGEEAPSRFVHLLDRINRSRYMWDKGTARAVKAADEPAWESAPGDGFRLMPPPSLTPPLMPARPAEPLDLAPPPPAFAPGLPPPQPRPGALPRPAAPPPTAAGAAGVATAPAAAAPPAAVRPGPPAAPAAPPFPPVPDLAQVRATAQRTAASPHDTTPITSPPPPAPARVAPPAAAPRPAASMAPAPAAPAARPTAPAPPPRAAAPPAPPANPPAASVSAAPPAAAPAAAGPLLRLAPEELAELQRPVDAAPRLTLPELEQRLQDPADRDEVGTLLLDFLAEEAPRAALFMARKDGVVGWMARGAGVDETTFREFQVDYGRPSVFLTLRQGSGSYRGPLAPLPVHRELARAWGGRLPRECVLAPVRIKDRLVTVLYVDNDGQESRVLDAALLERLATLAAAAFERCIVRQKTTR